MKKLFALTLAALMLVGMLVSCSGQDLNFGKQYVAADTQMNVLVQLNAKSADVGIMDSVMAGYYLSQDTTYANSLQLADDMTLAVEEYGIAARKGSALIKAINTALVALKADGTLDEIAKKYGLENELLIDADTEIAAPTEEELKDWNYIVNKGEVVVGYTEFAPIAYKEDGKLIGFDIELAKAVADVLDLDVKFELIDWSAKEAKLEAKAIDCIWNGMSITPEREEQMEISLPYLYNKQVAIIRVADKDKYTDKDSMARAIIGAEAGSAGEACIVKAKEE